MGFAGLSQTTVERLIRDGDGGRRGETAHKAPMAPPHQLADLRHVLGGECAHAPGAGDAADDLRRELLTLQRTVRQAGGEGSEMWHVVREAWEYAAGTPAERSARTDESWRALLQMLRYELPKPTWKVATTGGEEEEQKARRELAETIATQLESVGAAADGQRTAWARGAAKEGARREAMEQRRDLMRVILRAWREARDGVPAGAARYEAAADERDRARGEGAVQARTLGDRLCFGPRAGGVVAKVGP